MNIHVFMYYKLKHYYRIFIKGNNMLDFFERRLFVRLGENISFSVKFLFWHCWCENNLAIFENIQIIIFEFNVLIYL